MWHKTCFYCDTILLMSHKMCIWWLMVVEKSENYCITLFACYLRNKKWKQKQTKNCQQGDYIVTLAVNFIFHAWPTTEKQVQVTYVAYEGCFLVSLTVSNANILILHSISIFLALVRWVLFAGPSWNWVETELKLGWNWVAPGFRLSWEVLFICQSTKVKDHWTHRWAKVLVMTIHLWP